MGPTTLAEIDLVDSLPPIRSDVDAARADLDRYGVTRIAHALDADTVAALRRRTEEQAAAEEGAGIAFHDAGGANQRLWNLPSKGRVYRDLLTHPLVRDLARHVLEGDYCLSSHTANIAGPGGEAMVLHSDQGYAPRHLPIALAVNFMWMVSDFTEENGATRVIPGSHRLLAEPPRSTDVPTLAGTGPAGTVLVFDGRIWHGTGANTTADERRTGVLTYFCRPWLRPQENFTVSTHPDALADMDDECRTLLGFRVWRTLGGVQGPWGAGTHDMLAFRTSGMIDRDAPRVGELRRTGA